MRRDRGSLYAFETLRSEAHVIPATIVKHNKANKQNKLSFNKHNFSTAVQRSDKLKHSEFIPAFSLKYSCL